MRAEASFTGKVDNALISAPAASSVQVELGLSRADPSDGGMLSRRAQSHVATELICLSTAFLALSLEVFLRTELCSKIDLPWAIRIRIGLCFHRVRERLGAADSPPDQRSSATEIACPLPAPQSGVGLMSPKQPGKGGKPPGLPKSGGRKRGTPNRSSQAIREIFADLDYDPASELINLARGPSTPLEIRVHIHLQLLPYLYPKRRPVDATPEPMTTNVITTLDNSGECSDGPDNSPSAP